MHVHVSAISFLITALYVIIFGFIWRALSMKWHENAVGKAMAVIF